MCTQVAYEQALKVGHRAKRTEIGERSEPSGASQRSLGRERSLSCPRLSSIFPSPYTPLGSLFTCYYTSCNWLQLRFTGHFYFWVWHSSGISNLSLMKDIKQYKPYRQRPAVHHQDLKQCKIFHNHGRI